MTWTWRRFRVSVAVALFLLAMGFGVRYAEDCQVGYTHDASTWVFAASGLTAYYAAIIGFVLGRRARRRAKTPATHLNFPRK